MRNSVMGQHFARLTCGPGRLELPPGAPPAGSFLMHRTPGIRGVVAERADQTDEALPSQLDPRPVVRARAPRPSQAVVPRATAGRS